MSLDPFCFAYANKCHKIICTIDQGWFFCYADVLVDYRWKRSRNLTLGWNTGPRDVVSILWPQRIRAPEISAQLNWGYFWHRALREALPFAIDGCTRYLDKSHPRHMDIPTLKPNHPGEKSSGDIWMPIVEPQYMCLCSDTVGSWRLIFFPRKD